jgi:hypothetical protein
MNLLSASVSLTGRVGSATRADGFGSGRWRSWWTVSYERPISCRIGMVRFGKALVVLAK